MVKKYLKYLLINILIILSILLLADYLYFKHIVRNYRLSCLEQNIPFDANIRYKTYDFIKANDRTTTNVYKYFLKNKHYREPIYPTNKTNKSPIILFGCSYTWLDNNEGLQKLLSEYTQRMVFNFSYWGWGAQHTYYLTKNPLLYKIIDEHSNISPQYALYTYIRDHKNRTSDVMDYFVDIEPYLTYEIKNNELKLKEYNIFHKLLYRFFTYRYIKKMTYEQSETEEYEILYNLLIESNNELKKHYPKIKFIVLEYRQEQNIIEEEEYFFKKLEQSGITVISTNSLTNEDLYDKKYTQDDGYHPTPVAWELISKELAEKIEKK